METIIFDEPDVIEKIISKKKNKLKSINYLILWNTDFHTFDEVIMCLAMYIGKTFEEAAEIAAVVHLTGKASIMEGSFNELKPYYEILVEKTLKVSIE